MRREGSILEISLFPRPPPPMLQGSRMAYPFFRLTAALARSSRLSQPILSAVFLLSICLKSCIFLL